MVLGKYRKKRSFEQTGEPPGKKKMTADTGTSEKIFVIQKHAATVLHYDLRLEWQGVLKSWAITKEPSNKPGRLLAIMVEDHPYDYKDFEGVIPKGNYGAGAVLVWDEGGYELAEKDFHGQFENLDKITFYLNGKKLKGEFALIRLIKAKEKNAWLFIKANDEYAGQPIEHKEKSVKSGKTLKEIKNTSDPIIKKIIKSPEEPMPELVKPMLSKLLDQPFDNKDWIFEIKFDGYRIISYLAGKEIKLLSRKGLLYNANFFAIVNDLEKIKYQAIFDGEIVALDKEGRSDFALLQDYIKNRRGQIFYQVFDIIYLEGHNLSQLPLAKRKEILKKIIPSNLLIKYTDDIEGRGIAFLNQAKKIGLEGIMAKNKKSPYQAGTRSPAWLKIKIGKYQEAVVCGFTAPRESRRFFGALILGVYENNQLIYIGHTGTGFSDSSIKESFVKMQPFITNRSPFKVEPKTNENATWLKPELVCEVRYASWTADGFLRQPVFLRWRDDKIPKSAIRELPIKLSKI